MPSVMGLPIKKYQFTFLCCLYGKPKISDPNIVRYEIFKSQYEPKSEKNSFSIHNGIDMSLLPPCVSSLRLHSLRANYQTFIWKHSHVGYTDLPMPEGNGWTKNEMGILCVDWTSGDIMPQQLVDILSDNEKDKRDPVPQSDDVEDDDDEEDSTETEPGYHYELFENEIEERDEIDNIIDVVFEDEDEDY